MPIIPHAFSFFDSVGLLLRRDAGSFAETPLDWQMSLEEAQRYVEGIGQFVRDDRLHSNSVFASPLPVSLLGGDPLADLPALEAMLTSLTSYGLAAEVWTTGSWVVSEAQARDALSAVRAMVHALRVQTSFRLMEGAGARKVEMLLEAARTVGITVDIHCGVTPTIPLARELLALEVVNNGTSFIHTDAALDLLPADRWSVPDDGFFLSAPSRQRCAEKFGFFVAPGGPVYPCLAGVGNDALRIGDLSKQDVASIVSSVRGDEALIQLREHGPRGTDVALLSAEASKLSGRYADNCDFHRQVLAQAAAINSRVESAS